MDAILSNQRYRAIFLSSSCVFLIALFLVRYKVLPSFNARLPHSFTEISAALVEGLITTSIVTIMVAAFIFFATPAVMRVARIEAVEPQAIGALLREASVKSVRWTLKGGMGRYTRAETLAMLVRVARQSGVRRKIRLILIDPDDERACTGYAIYRNGLFSASKKEPLTAASVRDQILATILATAKVGVSESMIDVELVLLPIWSVMRIDLSDQYVLITSEDGREPGLRADNGTPFYNTYAKDLDLIARQGRSLPQLECLLGLQFDSAGDLSLLLDRLGLTHSDLDAARLERIWNLIAHGGHQYE
jgi:hypothetical protein